MKEYIAGLSRENIDRNFGTTIMASSLDEAVKKPRSMNIISGGFLSIKSPDGEFTDHSITPLKPRQLGESSRLLPDHES